MSQTILELQTPAPILDLPRLERNAFRMREKVRSLGVTLRPHVKTSKSIDVLRVLAGSADVPITVSTLAEARYFFDRLGRAGLHPRTVAVHPKERSRTISIRM